jgi:hypothetical protein
MPYGRAVDIFIDCSTVLNGHSTEVVMAKKVPPGYTRYKAYFYPPGGENGFINGGKPTHTVKGNFPSTLSTQQVEDRARQAVGNNYTLAYVEEMRSTPPD